MRSALARLLGPLTLALLVSGSQLASAQPAAHTQAKLLLEATTAPAGETVLAAIQLRMEPTWHTYWRNGGEAGAPTKVQWTLPPGVTAGQILWPVPEKYNAGGILTYIYHDEVLLLVPLTLASSLPAGPLRLSAAVDWLECAELCQPGDAKVEAVLTIGPERKPSGDAALLAAWKKKLPLPPPGFPVEARWVATPDSGPRTLAITWPPQNGAAKGDFFPFASDSFDVAHATEQTTAGGQIGLRKKVDKLEGTWPTTVAGLLIEQDKAGKTLAAYEVNLPVTAAPAGAGLSGPKASLLAMLGLAFLGGLILNVMPCVLPVIALKVLGFVNQSREDPGRVRRLGLIYALGVLASFLVMAGLVIGVQQAGNLASWGMQFQNPQFLVLITALVTLVALNLFGLFEVNLGGSVMGAATNLAYREGASGAFFNGVLATALATPCTAPFLGVALGFAFTQPPAIIVLMFLTIGLGLALPYLAFSWFPALLRFLPKPGVWMERFKVAMGFPMLATAIWLFSILSRHYGKSGVLWVGLFLVTLALAAWIWGEFVQRGRQRKLVARVAALLVLATGYGYGLEGQLHWRHPPENVAGALVENDPNGIPWKPWSTAAVAEARGQGLPVFVDFTADWCVTCKANKTSSIEIDSVRAKLKEIGAVALLADYTLRSTAITEELRRFGRAGVPLVLVYPKDATKPPEVLPTVLTPGIVLDALNRAAATTTTALSASPGGSP